MNDTVEKNLEWLKEQIDAALDRNCKYMVTLGELVIAELNSPSVIPKPEEQPDIDFKGFFQDSIDFQFETLQNKIEQAFDEFGGVLHER